MMLMGTHKNKKKKIAKAGGRSGGHNRWLDDGNTQRQKEEEKDRKNSRK